MKVISRTHIGNVRASNQDSVLNESTSRLYGVADGMGGHNGGDIASQMAVLMLPRILESMEANEENLKISTMKKVAEALNCEFVYYLKPNSTFQDIVQNQATKKAEEIFQNVNLNMALENQSITMQETIEDMVNDFINSNTKRIWD